VLCLAPWSSLFLHFSQEKKKKAMEVEESTLERMRLLNESNTKFYRDVKAVCAKLTMSEKDVLGVYLYGSRLWGSATAKSDYDFLVVAKNALAKAEGSWTVHSGNCDFLLMTEKVFAQRLAQQTFLVTVIAHWLPPEWKWKQHTLPSPLPAIDKNKFVQAVLAEVERDWTVANKKRDKGMKGLRGGGGTFLCLYVQKQTKNYSFL
jgi:hypothetical protein